MWQKLKGLKECFFEQDNEEKFPQDAGSQHCLRFFVFQFKDKQFLPSCCFDAYLGSTLATGMGLALCQKENTTLLFSMQHIVEHITLSGLIDIRGKKLF